MSTYADDPFFQVPRHEAPTSEGPVELPVLYYETRNVMALFLVDTARVAAALEGTGLAPGLTIGAKAVAGLSFYDYRDTTIGEYGEVGLAVSAVPSRRPRPRLGWLDLLRDVQMRGVGFHILDLPVTTPVAWAAGRELWGYPKFVTPIGFELTNDRFRGVVEDPAGDGFVVSLEGRLGLGFPVPPMSLLLYSRRGDQDVRATVHVRGPVSCRRGRGFRVAVGASRHPMAERIRSLGLAGARPLAVMTAPRLQSRLAAGAPIDLGGP